VFGCAKRVLSLARLFSIFPLFAFLNVQINVFKMCAIAPWCLFSLSLQLHTFQRLEFPFFSAICFPSYFCLRHCCDMKIVLFAFRLFSLFSALICELPGEGGPTIPLIPDLAFVGFPPTFILFISSSQK